MGGDSEVVVCVRVCMWSVCVLNIEINHSQLTFILLVFFCLFSINVSLLCFGEVKRGRIIYGPDS